MNNIKDMIKSILLIVLGNFVLAAAVSFFILPNNILTGGVAGVAIALYPFFHIEPEIMINIIIVTSFLMGYLFLGKEFALKTLASTILYPLFIYLFNLFEFQTQVDPLLASIYGGMLTGVGLGLTFRTGASTGGMDIPPLILAKYTNIRVAIWIMILDTLVILLGLKAYGLNQVLIGFASIFTTTFAIDKIQFIGGDEAKQVIIITEYIEDVLNIIHLNIDRGSTVLKAQGGYTKEKKDVILTVLYRSQYSQLEKLVKEVDPEAFFIVSDVTEVHGNGFYRV